MKGDYCKTYEVLDYLVQENGIVRNKEGTIIGRLSYLEEFKTMEETLWQIASGCGSDSTKLSTNDMMNLARKALKY